MKKHIFTIGKVSKNTFGGSFGVYYENVRPTKRWPTR